MNLRVSDVLKSLERLADDKCIRVIDHQFARFIAQYESNNWVILASAIASHQSGLGHVCVDLSRVTSQMMLGTQHSEIQSYFDNSGLGELEHWPRQMITALNSSSAQGDNCPLKLVGSLLYLQRFWNFEQQLSQFLHQRCHVPSAMPVNISEPLAALFSPDYPFIYEKLAVLNAQHLPVNNFCCDFFHLRDDLPLDYRALELALREITSVDALTEFSKQFTSSQLIDWQRVAVAIASRQKFSVISGGPGTGKTTTVIKLLALLIELDLNANPQDVGGPLFNIELVAPTGKAAARLSESISSALNKLCAKTEIKSRIPTSASTIHRLLGVIPNSNRFKHYSDNKLHVDVLIVDEASMIDISLMARLFDAIAPHTKVVLLGDSDQLASVEAGSVFADICGDLAKGSTYDTAMLDWLAAQTGFEPSVLSTRATNEHRSVVADSLAFLHKSYRFGQFSGIGALAAAVNQSDLSALKAVWQRGFQDIGLHPQGENAQRQIVQMSVNHYQDYLKLAKDVANLQQIHDVLKGFNRFQLLSPMRSGKYGIDELNQAIERSLSRYNFVDLSQGVWYVGRPIMINSNDHSQQLYNGDIGIFMPDIDQPHGPGRVYFIMANGEVKSFLPSRLPSHDTVYAMTIHKSQGSEFDNVVIALPQHWTALLTKELIYTGITRAKDTVDIFSSAKVLTQAMQTKTLRVSGLANCLLKAPH